MLDGRPPAGRAKDLAAVKLTAKRRTLTVMIAVGPSGRPLGTRMHLRGITRRSYSSSDTGFDRVRSSGISQIPGHRSLGFGIRRKGLAAAAPGTRGAAEG